MFTYLGAECGGNETNEIRSFRYLVTYEDLIARVIRSVKADEIRTQCTP